MARLLLSTLLMASGCRLGPAVPDRPLSYLQMRFEATVAQGKDFTCGAASLATILTYYWGVPTTESAALATLEGRYTRDEIADIGRHGLSFSDLIFMTDRLGFSAEGVSVSQAELANLAGPVIIHLNKGTFQHFVVLRRVGSTVYYVSDPVVGQLAMSEADFSSQYTGNALVVWRKGAAPARHEVLTNPRDGIRVGDTLRREINVTQEPFLPGL